VKQIISSSQEQDHSPASSPTRQQVSFAPHSMALGYLPYSIVRITKGWGAIHLDDTETAVPPLPQLAGLRYRTRGGCAAN